MRVVWVLYGVYRGLLGDCSTFTACYGQWKSMAHLHMIYGNMGGVLSHGNMGGFYWNKGKNNDLYKVGPPR